MGRAVRSPEGKIRHKEKAKLYAKKKRTEKENTFYRTRQLFYQSCARARKRGLEHTLVLQDLFDIWPPGNKCPIYGTELKWNTGLVRKDSPSLDRIDNTKGYTKDNIQIISFRANELKSNATLEELELLVNYLKQGE